MLSLWVYRGIMNPIRYERGLRGMDRKVKSVLEIIEGMGEVTFISCIARTVCPRCGQRQDGYFAISSRNQFRNAAGEIEFNLKLTRYCEECGETHPQLVEQIRELGVSDDGN